MTARFQIVKPTVWLLCNALAGTGFSASIKPLTLDEVLASVSHSYPQVKIARLEVSRAKGAYISAKGRFDPALEAETRSQPMGGYINNYGDTQITIPTLYNGLKWHAGYRNGEGDWPIYYQNYLTNSGGEYRVGLSLPLLRDRLIDKERTELLSTAQMIHIKHLDAEQVKIKIYQESIKAYWQWVEAGQQLKIFEDLLKLAKTRQNAIEKQAHQGDLPMLAIAENQQQIIQREQLLNQGRMIYEQAAINLSLYFRDAKGSPVVPVAKRLPHAVSGGSNTGFVKPEQVMAHPGLRKLENYFHIVKLKRDLARNELLPNLDAAAYTSKQNGTGGYPLMIPQAALVGLTFKFPLFQREAKGRVIRAQRELHQIMAEKQLLYDRLYNELSSLLVGIRRWRQQVVLLKRELGLARQVEQGESKRFSAGDSTLFLVNQREQTTTQVALNGLHAQVTLRELQDKVRFFISTHADDLHGMK